jgi:hypothetical protein
VFLKTRRASSRASYAARSTSDSGSNVRGFSNAKPNGSGAWRAAGGRGTPSA